MRAAVYFDLTVQREAALRGPSGTAIAVMAKTLVALHAIGLRLNLEFASAFPLMKMGERAHPGTVLRAFVGSREDADALAEALEENTFLMGYIHVGRSKLVPASLEKTVEYRLFKIPSQRSYNRTPDRGWKTESRGTPAQRRAAKIKKGDSLPFLRVESSSNLHAFSIRVEQIEGNEAQSVDFKPNSYGLGSAANKIFLPHIVAERQSCDGTNDG